MQRAAPMLLLLTGCAAAGGIASPVPFIEVPSLVEVDGAIINEPLTLAIPVQNLGTEIAGLDTTVSEPFIGPNEVITLGPGDRKNLFIALVPSTYGDFEGSVRISTGYGIHEIALSVRIATDADGDGFDAKGAGGSDCDDLDPLIRPGATELCDGIDRDCNGMPDDAAPLNAPTWYLDNDGDGHGTWRGAFIGCNALPGYVATAGDCDDGDAEIHPLASEVYYNGIDEDCDGRSDYDADQDGCDASPWGDDCDDTDPSMNQGATEVYYDGVDQDCRGDSDYDADHDGHEAEPWGDDCDDGAAWLSPSAIELDNGFDDDCDSRVDEGYLNYGDLVITEVLLHPAAVDAEDGQYVEVTNVSHRDVFKNQVSVLLDDEPDVMDSKGFFEPGDVVVVCVNDKWFKNGDLPCTARHSGLLENTVSLRFTPTGELVDEVVMTSLPSPVGASIELAAFPLSADDNDDAGAWCEATTPWANGDFGTPGTVTPSCP
jgi:hypothetical protein